MDSQRTAINNYFSHFYAKIKCKIPNSQMYERGSGVLLIRIVSWLHCVPHHRMPFPRFPFFVLKSYDFIVIALGCNQLNELRGHHHHHHYHNFLAHFAIFIHVCLRTSNSQLEDVELNFVFKIRRRDIYHVNCVQRHQILPVAVLRIRKHQKQLVTN